jgi:predicted phage-related endonuclease
MEIEMGTNNEQEIEKAVQNAVQFAEIMGKLVRIEDGISDLKTKNSDMAEDITKIKDAIYGPDDGIYARLKELESWKNSTSKVLWILITAVTGGAVGFVFNYLKH